MVGLSFLLMIAFVTRQMHAVVLGSSLGTDCPTSSVHDALVSSCWSWKRVLCVCVCVIMLVRAGFRVGPQASYQEGASHQICPVDSKKNH